MPLPKSPHHKSPNRFQSIFTPYGLTLDLEDYFHHKFKSEEFYSIVDTIATGRSQNSQINIFNLFKKLSMDEVIRRSKIVSRLSKVLLNIQIQKGSNDISRSLSETTK
jgi:hypothetical protein